MPLAVVNSVEYLTFGAYSEADAHKKSENLRAGKKVNTVLRNDLLADMIDYLSIDTEGSELEILNAFEFECHIFSVTTCEHNFLNQRKDIYDLLARNCYARFRWIIHLG